MTVLSTLSKETRITAEAGVLIAVILTGFKFQSLYQDIVKAAYKDFRRASTYYIDTSHRLHSAAVRRSKFSKSRINSAVTRILSHPRVQICIALFHYFIRFPLFVAALRLMMKCIALVFKQQKYVTAISTFIAAFFCQYKFKLFHWKWTLLLLIRSIYSLTRLLTPTHLQPNVVYVYPLIHSACAIMLTWYYQYVPSKWWSLFENCLNEKRERCKYMFCHNHGMLPPCNILHDDYNQRCIVSFLKDILRKIPYILTFFGKFYLLTTLINVPKWTGAIRKRKMGKFFVETVKNLIGSSAFFLITAVSFRLPCFYGAVMKILTNKSFVINNKAVFLCLNAILGYFAILCESKSRRLMVALSCIWNSGTEIVRMMFNLKSDDNAKYHKKLSSDSFVSLLFALNMSIVMFVYCSNPKAVKSMERMLIKKYFV